MLTAQVQAALGDRALTDEERTNIEIVLKFRELPFAERGQYMVDGLKLERAGMANLEALKHRDAPNYDPSWIPDRHDETLDIIAQGDRVWATWLIRGTHLGSLYGIPATGRSIEVVEMGQFRFRDGLITQAWLFLDELGLMRQLGLWPSEPGAGIPLGEAAHAH